MTIKSRKVSPSQAAVYGALKSFGKRGLPDHALVPYVQHAVGDHLSSSRIRTARRELQSVGLVADTLRTVRTGSGRKASVFRAVK